VAAIARRTRRWPRRWWLFRPLDLMARVWPVWREKRGVLVIRMDGIGDMVLFQGAFRHYPEALGVPRSEITVLGGASWASLAETVYQGCRFRAIDEHAYDRRPLYRFRISLWVRRQGFRAAVCDAYFRKPLVADSLVYVSGAPLRIVAKPYTSPKTQAQFDWHLARVHQVIDTGPYPTHEVVRHFRFVSAIAGRPFRAETPALPWRRAPRPLAAPYVVLNLGSNEPGRRWPLAAFLEIAEHLARRGLTIVFTGGRVEAALRAGGGGRARLALGRQLCRPHRVDEPRGALGSAATRRTGDQQRHGAGPSRDRVGHADDRHCRRRSLHQLRAVPGSADAAAGAFRMARANVLPLLLELHPAARGGRELSVPRGGTGGANPRCRRGIAGAALG